MTRSLLILTAALAITSPAFADETSFSLDELTCFEVQSLAEEDSLFLTGMLIGHAKGDAPMTPAEIKSAIEGMDATCGENPDMLAMDALS